jgi:hypothetical protein
MFVCISGFLKEYVGVNVYLLLSKLLCGKGNTICKTISKFPSRSKPSN